MPNPYTVGNAPEGASYTVPRLDQSWLGDLPQTYYQGQQARRQNALATAFQNPEEFKNADGSYDFGKMTDKVLSIAGMDAANPMLNQMLRFQMARQFGLGQPQPNVGEELPGPSPRAAAPLPVPGGARGPNTGPDHLRPPVAQAGYDSQGDSIRSLVTERLPGADGQNLINYLAGKAFPGDDNGADRTLNADQTAAMGKAIEGYKTQRAQRPQQVAQSGAQPTAQAQQQPATPQQGAIGAQPGPGPAPSGNYAPNVGAPNAQRSEAGIPREFSQAARDMVESALNASVARDQATAIMFPESAKQDNPRTAALRDRLKQIDEFRSKWFTRTPEQQNAASEGTTPLGYEQRKKINEADTKHADDLFNGIQGQADISARMVENLRQQKAFVNNPEFTSGNFNEAELWLKRQMPSIFGQPTSMELYRKTLAENIKTEMSSLRTAAESVGSTATRIFVPEIKQIETMSGGLDNSVTGLRALAEIRLREHERNVQLASFAAAYKTGRMNSLPPEFRAYGQPPVPGMLDTNFEQGLRDWMGKHPLFDKDELNDPRRMGARDLPRVKTPQEAMAWAQKAGVQKGEPVRHPDGHITYWKGQ